jgi:[ribosomal protein S5]-alanine N-acetyltransferase
MNSNLIFETERLVLKPILENESDLLYAILTDRYVRRYLCDDEILSLETVKKMLVQSQETFKKQKFGLWSIEIKSEKIPIGFVGLWYFFEEPQPQLAYALLPQFTKKGYATEAASKIIEYCFNDLGYRYLIASCDEPNYESQKVARRIGMEQIERRIINGKPLLFFKIEKMVE